MGNVQDINLIYDSTRIPSRSSEYRRNISFQRCLRTSETR